jgi:hypothetical protein
MIFPILFIFFRLEENEPKEDARVPLHPARRHGVRGTRKLPPPSPRLRRGSNRSVRLYPAAAPMPGAGQREIQTQNLKNRFQALFEGAS